MKISATVIRWRAGKTTPTRCVAVREMWASRPVGCPVRDSPWSRSIPATLWCREVSGGSAIWPPMCREVEGSRGKYLQRGEDKKVAIKISRRSLVDPREPRGCVGVQGGCDVPGAFRGVCVMLRGISGALNWAYMMPRDASIRVYTLSKNQRLNLYNRVGVESDAPRDFRGIQFVPLDTKRRRTLEQLIAE